MTTPETETERLYGMAEADRQIRVAKRLYEATHPAIVWENLGPGHRRPFIDQSCHLPYADQHN